MQALIQCYDRQVEKLMSEHEAETKQLRYDLENAIANQRALEERIRSHMATIDILQTALNDRNEEIELLKKHL